jgi:hypothetical protein
VLRELIRGGAVLKVAEAPTQRRSNGSPILYGWAGRHGDHLIYCYVRHDLREFPVIPALLEQLAFEGDIPVMFPTRQLRAINKHWQLNFRSEKE